jgi:hypothetical protein
MEQNTVKKMVSEQMIIDEETGVLKCSIQSF